MSSEEDVYPEPLVIEWQELSDEERLALRTRRRLEHLFQQKPIYLDDHEAADYIGVPVQELRELVEDGILHLQPDTQLLDVEELQIYLLAVSDDVEGRRAAVLRRVRWEAEELELYPLFLRDQLVADFVQVWGRLAKKFARDGMHEEAAGVRSIVRQAQLRLKDVTTAN
ncbi:MAG TPA: hypothetical protein VGF28_24195 [Thermoanaerobaculia bacterium]|jgi:hypothetical protein